jgi:hypothetical protein
MPETVHYVYAVTGASRALSGAPGGIAGVPLAIEAEGELGAIVSVLPAADYEPELVEEKLRDMEWLGPRARTHDDVVTWASDSGEAVPLPMFTLFRDAAGVRRMLRERSDTLLPMLRRLGEGREYGVRVFRIDAQLESHLGSVSDRVAELEKARDAATPGQRYLLERKLDSVRQEELRRAGAAVADECFGRLVPLALDAVRNPLPRAAAEGSVGSAVLNAAFLVARTDPEPFQRELTAIIEEKSGAGFRFEFTGPWPPYNFARGAAADE